MQEIKMNMRVKKVLLRICKEAGYVTISSIAKELGVSTKTVVRELSEAEQWLESKGCTLSKKTGVGIKVNGSEDRKKMILALLQGEKEESIYTPKERQIVIISELLQNQEPVKLYNFTKILKVTEGTISNDLDKIEQWFAKQELTLVRKPGLGVYVEGPENRLRKAMVHFIYENIDEDQLLGIIRSSLMQSSEQAADLEATTRSRLLNLIDKNVIHKLEASIHEAQEQMGHRLADSAYVGLIVHLALAVQRIRKNEEIIIDGEFLQELKEYPEYTVAEHMAGRIAQNFGITLPESEIGYITMHIKGSKNRNDYKKDGGKSIGNFELVKLSKDIIRIAEGETGQLLGQNENLLVGLVNHLGPSISRLKMGLEIRNPFVEEIKAFYPDLVEISRRCAKVVEEKLGLSMPESEIAYIAMHLGAALETGEKVPKSVYRCAIACSTGIGTSRLLATKLEKEFDNIHIGDIISTIHLDEKRLEEQNIDFIISTVSIDRCSMPVVTVNPLLFEEDKNKILHLMRRLGTRVNSYPAKDRLVLKERLRAMESYGRAVLQLLEGFFLLEDEESCRVEEVIDKVSGYLGENAQEAEQLSKALRDREDKGGTFITGHGLILLHCRTAAVKGLCFGAARMGKVFYAVNGRGEQEIIQLAIVMVAPDSADRSEMETIGHLSKMLLERPEFTRLLKAGDREKAGEEVAHILEDFYRKKYKKLMEG